MKSKLISRQPGVAKERSSCGLRAWLNLNHRPWAAGLLEARSSFAWLPSKLTADFQRGRPSPGFLIGVNKRRTGTPAEIGRKRLKWQSSWSAGGVPIGADRDPTPWMILPVVSDTWIESGWGPTSALKHTDLAVPVITHDGLAQFVHLVAPAFQHLYEHTVGRAQQPGNARTRIIAVRLNQDLVEGGGRHRHGDAAGKETTNEHPGLSSSSRSARGIPAAAPSP